jgi:hypothetical protein
MEPALSVGIVSGVSVFSLLKIVQSWPLRPDRITASSIPRDKQTIHLSNNNDDWPPCLAYPQNHCQNFSESQKHRVTRKAPHQVDSLHRKQTKAPKQEKTRRARMLGRTVHRAAVIKMPSRAKNRKRISHRSLKSRTKNSDQEFCQRRL